MVMLYIMTSSMLAGLGVLQCIERGGKDLANGISADTDVLVLGLVRDA